MPTSRCSMPTMLLVALLGTALTACGGSLRIDSQNALAVTPVASASAVLAGAMATGSAATAAAEPAVATAPSATPAPKETAGQTPPAEICAALRPHVATIVAVEVAQTVAPLEDHVAGTMREGCQLTARWTGTLRNDVVDVSQEIMVLLAAQGWSDDQRYAADGPTGTMLGFTRGGQFAILTVDWRPAPEVQCPSDQIITECEMLPEQRLYAMTLNIGARDLAGRRLHDDGVAGGMLFGAARYRNVPGGSNAAARFIYLP